ncbi:MAG: recombinase family protein [Butyricicoccus sp.]|nr:recombinase family protein [Butyricicoccus sp.]
MVAIYTRQSVERADSISVEQQAQLCRDALTAGEARACKVYTDKGFSGKNIDRPALQQLLADVEAGQVEKILVYRLDRISRSVHDFTGLCASLSAHGVHFQSVTDGITLDDTLSGTVMAQIMMVFAQFERETIQRRVTDNYIARAKAGMYLGGRPPFGFDKGKTVVGGKHTACYVPHPQQAALMAALYERYAQDGQTLGSLVRWLNANGHRTARGGNWSTLPLGRLLRSPAFVRADAAVYRYLQGKGATMNDPISSYDQQHGCYCYTLPHATPPGKRPATRKFTDLSGSFVTLAPHEGLVDAALWLDVQHKLDRNRALKSSGSGSHSWLSGRMKCKKCGYAITVVNKPAGMRGHYINCGGHKRGNAVCPGRSGVITLEDIEGAVEAQLLHFLTSYRAVPIQAQPRRSAQVNQIEIQIDGREKEIQRLTQNLTQILEPDVIQIVAAQIHEANEQLSALQAQRAALLHRESSADLEPYFDAVLTEWPDYTIEEKKRIAQAVIDRVWVDDDTIEVVFRAAYGV